MRKTAKSIIQATILTAALSILSLYSYTSDSDSSNDISKDEIVYENPSLYSVIYKQLGSSVYISENHSVFEGVTKSLVPTIATSMTTYNEIFVRDPIEEDETDILEVVEVVEPEKPEEEIVEEIIVEPEPEPEFYLTNDEVELLAILTMAEAEGESELGKRLVIDTVLNRISDKRYPNSVYDVVYSGAYEAMHNGRSGKCYAKDDICQLVREEAMSRTNTRVLYFRTRKYHSFGTPEIHEGHHYFSS